MLHTTPRNQTREIFNLLKGEAQRAFVEELERIKLAASEEKKPRLWTIKRVDREVLAKPMTWDYHRGERKELWEEIKKMSPSGIREEWSDVALSGQLAAHANGWPGVAHIPVLPGTGLYALKKVLKRMDGWKTIFTRHGADFDKKHLGGGSNYGKLSKVRAALESAGVDPADLDVRWLKANGYGKEEEPSRG